MFSRGGCRRGRGGTELRSPPGSLGFQRVLGVIGVDTIHFRGWKMLLNSERDLVFIFMSSLIRWFLGVSDLTEGVSVHKGVRLKGQSSY